MIFTRTDDCEAEIIYFGIVMDYRNFTMFVYYHI